MELDSNLTGIPATALDDSSSHTRIDVILKQNRIVPALDRGILRPRSAAVSVGLIRALGIQANINPGTYLIAGIESIVCMDRAVGAQIYGVDDREIDCFTADVFAHTADDSMTNSHGVVAGIRHLIVDTFAKGGVPK